MCNLGQLMRPFEWVRRRDSHFLCRRTRSCAALFEPALLRMRLAPSLTKTSEMNWKIFLNSLKELQRAVSPGGEAITAANVWLALGPIVAEKETTDSLWNRAKISPWFNLLVSVGIGGGRASLWATVTTEGSLILVFVVIWTWNQSRAHICLLMRLAGYLPCRRATAKSRARRFKAHRHDLNINSHLTFRYLNSSIIPLNYSNVCPSLSLSPSLPLSLVQWRPVGFLCWQEESCFSQPAKTHSWAEDDPLSEPVPTPPSLPPSLSGSHFYSHFSPSVLTILTTHIPPTLVSLSEWTGSLSERGGVSIYLTALVLLIFICFFPVWTLTLLPSLDHTPQSLRFFFFVWPSEESSLWNSLLLFCGPSLHFPSDI